MANMVRVRLIDPSLNPDDRLVVPVLVGCAGVDDNGGVKPGAEITVPEEVAGEPGSWQPIPEGHFDPSGFFQYRSGPRGGNPEYYHLGYGLLAQATIWEAVDGNPGDPAPDGTETYVPKPGTDVAGVGSYVAPKGE